MKKTIKEELKKSDLSKEIKIYMDSNEFNKKIEKIVKTENIVKIKNTKKIKKFKNIKKDEKDQ